MKITQVEPQKKNPRRFNIFLDGEFAFGADEDLVVSRRLVVGKIIAPEELNQILFEAEVGKLMERMYRLFNIRSRSEKEIRYYLRNLSFKRKVKGQEEISAFIIDTAVELMKKKGLVDDQKFTQDWVESRSKKKGKRAIKIELLQKGVDKEIIEKVMSDELLVHSELQTAEKLLEKKMRVWKNLEPEKLRQKAIEFLLRRGFEYNVVKEVVVEKMLERG